MLLRRIPALFEGHYYLATIALFLLIACGGPVSTHDDAVIIDVHRHGTWPESVDESYRDQMLAEMKENGVKLAVISLTDYDDIENWKDVSPDAFLAGVMVPCPKNLTEPFYKCFPSSEGWVDLAWLRQMVEDKKIEAIHEIGPNYYGISVSDAQLDPYWALAAEYDLSVGVHTQRGPPLGGKNSTRSDPSCCPNYDTEMGNPSLLRPVLDKYPNIRIWIQHVGAGRPGGYEPFWDETLALLKDYPNVYLDLSITNGPIPIAQYEESLKRLIDAGFGDRIMFGTDNLPTAMVLGRLNSIEWISEDQRNAILYENARRFFRLK